MFPRITAVFLSMFAFHTISDAATMNYINDQNKNHIYDISVAEMSGDTIKLFDYKGKVLMIVNVASKCGYTHQYEGLQKIYEKYKDRGFEILAFPCNDFGGQEPGSNEEIAEFCSSNYGITFKLFDKIKILGEGKNPLYERLVNNSNTEQGDVKWNFEKFIISRSGEIKARFRSAVEPADNKLIKILETELNK